MKTDAQNRWPKPEDKTTRNLGDLVWVDNTTYKIHVVGQCAECGGKLLIPWSTETPSKPKCRRCHK